MATVEVMRGFRIVEVADHVFVPGAASVLSDWGADVIKVEHHERGDAMRALSTWHPGNPPSPGFVTHMEPVNRGKRSIGINLGNARGREILYDLVRTADVFLTSKLTPVRQRLKFDVDDLRAINPKLIYVRGTGRGVRGEEADDGGFDALDFWYRSGIAMAAMPAEVQTPPFMPSGAFGDRTGAMHIAGGISAALLHRERTGEALVVDVSLLATGMWSFGSGIENSSFYGTNVRQNPAGPPPMPMVAAYRSSDARFIALCCLQGFHYFPDLCRVLDIPEVAQDARFSTQEAFDANGVELGTVFTDVFARFTFAELKARLSDFAGQWTALQTAIEVAGDPQALANGYISTMTSTNGREYPAITPPVQFNETPVSDLKSAPKFNEHGDEILGQLGLSDEQIIDLKIDGAIA